MNHHDFKFKAQFVDEVIDCRLQLYWPDNYYLFLDNHLNGILMKRSDSWTFTPTGTQEYNSDDILILAEMVKTNFNY